MPVVVVGGHTAGLAVVRALGEAGVPVYVLHGPREFAQTSRHVRGAWPVPDPREELAFVAAIERCAGSLAGAVLVPASDAALGIISRHRTALERHFRVACPAWPTTRDVLEKSRTYALAAAAGVPVPQTLPAGTLDLALAGAARLGYPVLVKPSEGHLYEARFGRKMVLVGGEGELTRRWREAAEAGLEVVMQEYVPGPDSEVVNYNAYAWDGRPCVEFTARQLRKAPPGLGAPRCVVSERVEGVLEPGRATLRALRFDGFTCSEFKRDPRDGRYKLLDVNGRANLSGILAVRCGIDFPLLQYRHLVHGELPEARPFREGVYWTDAVRDAGYGLRFLLQERLSPRQQLAPYLGPRCDALVDASDLGPLAARVGRLAASVTRRLLRGQGATPSAAATVSRR